ncbi:MAG: Trimethylamine methyltransferase family protein, partial [uncultured Thermoleophilia bacterium]
MFVNTMQRHEVLSPEAMATLERGWRRLLTEIGVEFDLPEALDLFRAAGQRVEGSIVFPDPDWVLEQLRTVPQQFELVGRDPARTVTIGGDSMVFSAVYGPPFVREGDVRREGTMHDYERLLMLVQRSDELDTPGGVICEPNDVPLDSRHLDMQLAMITLTDRPYFASVTSAENTRDSIRMAEILHGGREAIERSPVLAGIINVNSPLRYDERMLGGMIELARAGQPAIVTPFLLMGAMAPVSIPAAIVQQTAEAFAGIALTQLVRPGTPAILGSFLSTTDMQSGSPGFGGPESALGLFVTGQLARHYGLPWRAGGGGLTSSQTVDAQAAMESMNTMLPAFMAGANLVMHAAGWLESGLVSCFEKVVLDLEALKILQREFAPLEIDEASMAFEAHLEVGHGGHYLGAAHTLERFRDCFYRPHLSSTENFERWKRLGARDAAARAAEI